MISDTLPFGRLWYGAPDAVGHAISYAIRMSTTIGSVGHPTANVATKQLGMETQAQNINVIQSVWRRVNKDIKVHDLQPVKDVKGGGGVTGKSKSITGTTGIH